MIFLYWSIQHILVDIYDLSLIHSAYILDDIDDHLIDQSSVDQVISGGLIAGDEPVVEVEEEEEGGEDDDAEPVQNPRVLA